MFKRLALALVALVLIVGSLRTLSFGDAPSVEPTPTPTVAPGAPPPTPTVAPGAVAVTITADGINVSPRSVEGPAVTLALANRAPYMAEVVVRRGRDERVLALGTGEHLTEALELPAGRYEVAARPLTEGSADPQPAHGTATLRVR